MSEQQQPDDHATSTTSTTPTTAPNSKSDGTAPAMFATGPAEKGGVPLIAWGVAGLVVLAIIAGMMIATRRRPAAPNTIQPLAAYADRLPLSQLAMSESTSLSGGKSTYIDGHIRNAGGQTVTGITVQVLFSNDEGMPPEVETEPLSLIRTRQPYIDTEPVSAAPLKPGDEQDFRLIFEAIPANWNGQMPAIHIISVSTK